MATTTQPTGKLQQRSSFDWRAELRKLHKSYVVRVLAQGLLTIWAVMTFTFFLIRLMPGNPIDIKIDQLQRQQGISYQEARARAAEMFGYNPDQPVGEQYVVFIGQ